MPWRSLRAVARLAVARKLDLHIEGREHVPGSGGVLLASRHYHHLYDGAALFATLDRPTRIIVGLDWIRSAPLKTSMMAACRAAGWPVVYRSSPTNPVPEDEARALLRRATRETVQALQAGQIVIVFPEAYPNIDPSETPKRGDEFLPFEPGVVRLGQIAERQGVAAPIVPVGFMYAKADRWKVTMRFGEPVRVRPGDDPGTALADLQETVERLSRPA